MNASSDQSKRHRKRIIWWSVAIVLVLLLAAYLAIGAIAANKLTVAQRLFTDKSPDTYQMAYEEVQFPAQIDGLEIAAWYIPAEAVDPPVQLQNQPVIVMVHGWNASRTQAFDQHFLELAKDIHQAGMSVLMIDLRGHGQSADSRFTFGRLERRDVLAAVDWLVERGYSPEKIGLLGTSMGAASVVGAAAEYPTIGAVVTDSMFAEIYPVIQGLWKKQSGLPMIFLYPTRWMFWLMNGFDIASSRPIDEINKLSDRPLLMIHCKLDTDVPLEQHLRLAEAAAWAETWVVEPCQHSEIYDDMPEAYADR